MKYCMSCGQSLEDNEAFCRSCGKPCNAVANPSDTGNAGWGILGFLFPIVGLVLYLVWRNEQPKNARSAGIGALVNVIVGALSTVLIFFVFFSMFIAVLA